MFRRRPAAEQTGPTRGPGGGKKRVPRKEPRRRRRLGVADFATIAVIGAVLVFVLERFVAGASLLASLLTAVVVAFTSVLFNMWLERRRWRNAPPERPRRRRR